MNDKMHGRRPVGRKRTSLKDVLRRDLKSSDLTLEKAVTEALDRDRWRMTVLAACVYNAARS